MDKVSTQIQGLSSTDCNFQGLSRPRTFYFKFQGLSRCVRTLKLSHHCLAIKAQTKNIQIHFEFACFLFLSYSFGNETLNTFTHSVVPSKTIPDSRPKTAKCIPIFRPKRHKNPTRWGGTYLYGLYNEVPLTSDPPPSPLRPLLLI